MSQATMNPTSLNQAIEKHIRPNTFPLGIKMLKREEDIPEKAKRPGRDMHFDSALCQGMGIARHYGWTIAVSRKDISCPIGATLFGFQPQVDHFTQGHCCAGMYTKDAAAGAKTGMAERLEARMDGPKTGGHGSIP